MLTCAIIDDEPLAISLLESYVEKTPFLQLEGKFSNAIDAMAALRAKPVDLLMLDIQMPELSGLEFAKIISPNTRIIFTTAFSQYAIEGYKVNAIDYLLKPISYADFLASVSKARSLIEAQQATSSSRRPDSFFVKSDYKLVRICYDDILYIEGLKDYVKIHLASAPRPVLSLTSMHAVEAHLPSEKFQRIHRSFIVNLDRVSVLERGQIVFGEKRLPISDSYKEQIQHYINSRTLQGRNG
ncbi:MAG: response regulator transcription factor [Bacteroidaceae bacterium]|nr:response regulator transcription factor [Bacteroidaceae bacterium]MBR2862101.1 response regulator transcription factor [Bacteroidaceae bacterium]